MDLSTREGRREQGDRIKQAARDAGLTLDELARIIGCSRALIFQYASGASLPQPDRLQLIARAVGKPLHWFFLDEGETAESITAAGKPTAEQILAERLLLDSERVQIAAERSKAEQRRVRGDMEHLEALLSAASSPADDRKVIECCQQLQLLLAIEVKEDPEKLASVLLKHGNALIHLQEWGAAKERLEQAASIYRRIERPVLERDCMQSLGHANLMLGRVEEAIQQFEYVAASEDWTNRWQGTLSIGAANEMAGNFPAAIAAFEAAIAIVDERCVDPLEPRRTALPPNLSDTEVPRLFIEANWANLEIGFGDYVQALERSKLCIRIAQRNGVQDQYIEALLTSGIAHMHLGHLNTAVSSIQQALDVAQLTADRQHHSLALSCVALCEAAGRQPESAIAHGKEALALALRCNAQRAELLAQHALCEAYMVSSAPSEALYHAEQGLAIAVGSRLDAPQAQFTILKARALFASGRPAEAIAIAQSALESADQLQIRPVLLECHSMLARAALTAGDTRSASLHAARMIELAASMQLRHELWRGHSVAALSRVRGKRKDAGRAVFATASDLLAEAQRQLDLNGVSSIMEDPMAAELWQARLLHVMRYDGTDAARTLAKEADWPPLIDWLESRILSEGGKPDA